MKTTTLYHLSTSIGSTMKPQKIIQRSNNNYWAEFSSSQYTRLSNQKIIWICDAEGTTTFLDKEPPQNPKLQRWYVFLSQMPIFVFHCPGAKNELSGWLEFKEQVRGDRLD